MVLKFLINILILVYGFKVLVHVDWLRCWLSNFYIHVEVLVAQTHYNSKAMKSALFNSLHWQVQLSSEDRCLSAACSGLLHLLDHRLSPPTGHCNVPLAWYSLHCPESSQVWPSSALAQHIPSCCNCHCAVAHGKVETFSLISWRTKWSNLHAIYL